VTIALCAAAIVAVLILDDDGGTRHLPERSGESVGETARESSVDARAPSANIEGESGGPDRHFDCQPYPAEQSPTGEIVALLERSRRESERRAKALEVAEDADLSLAAAFLSLTDQTDPKYVDRLLRALSLDRANPVTLERLLDACINRAELRICAERGIVERAAEADGGNGEMWGAIAGYHVSRGHTDAALDALRRAASAGVYREYFVDYVRVMELGLAAAVADRSYGERITEAIGRAAAFTAPYLTAYAECRDRVADDPLWRDACLDFGRQLERRSQSALNRGIGIGLQVMIADETGDDAALAAAQARQRRYRVWRDEHLTMDGQVVLARDERVLRGYIDEWQAHGEPAALGYLREEIARLKQLPGYDPCALEPFSPDG